MVRAKTTVEFHSHELEELVLLYAGWNTEKKLLPKCKATDRYSTWGKLAIITALQDFTHTDSAVSVVGLLIA